MQNVSNNSFGCWKCIIPSKKEIKCTFRKRGP